jgi:hypothetical protein
MNEAQTSGGVDRGQVMLVVLVILAFIASIVMLFTDSDSALKIALLAALWAAVIGFFLVFRYRRDAEAARRELFHNAELHDVEVARAVAEQTADVESRALELREKQHAMDNDVLEDIKRELAGIRAQLEALAGREFGYEPAALRAEARRIMELERVTFADLEEDGDEEAAESEVPEPTGPPKVEGRITGAPSLDAVAGRIGQQPTRPEVNPLAALIAENQRREEEDEVQPEEDAQADIEETRVFDTGSFQTVDWEQGGTKSHATEPAQGPIVEQDATAAEQEERRGRRRRDENTAGVSVAELLARSRENQE